MSLTSVEPEAVVESFHTSTVLARLIDEAPDGHFTLGWLVECLPNRSFGIILLFLALIALLPIISIPAGILILILSYQIIAGYPGPVLPDKLMARPLPTRYLARLERYALPALRGLEKVLQPRLDRFLHVVRPITALVAMLLMLLLLINPIPLSNLPPATICALMALAYIEHDGILLIFAFTCAFLLLTGTAMLLW